MSLDQLKRMREALRPYGLKLLESEWKGWHAQYRFRCRKGHESSRCGSYLFYTMVQCPACRVDGVLRQIHQLARQAGGRCLSEQYAGRGTPLQFVCKAGHVFEKTAENLRKGSWCALCARAQHSKRMADPDGMTRMRGAANARGGKCLSTGYTKLTARYRFRCAAGHEWETSGSGIVRGAWCRICADREKVHAYRHKDGLARLRERARSHGGVCLSKVYEGSKAYYRFRGGADHEWETQGARIFRGAWCPECQREAMRFGIERMRLWARELGGRCLSETYRNAATRLKWECDTGIAGRPLLGLLFGGIGAQCAAATGPGLGSS